MWSGVHRNSLEKVFRIEVEEVAPELDSNQQLSGCMT